MYKMKTGDLHCQLTNLSLENQQFVCSPTSVLILFISSFFLNALAALFCFSIHLLSSRLKRDSVISSVLIPFSVGLSEIPQQTLKEFPHTDALP